MPMTERPPRVPSPRPPSDVWFPRTGPAALPGQAAVPGRAGVSVPGGSAGQDRAADPCPVRLICFPYAGGTPSVFLDWAVHLGEAVEVVPVLLPGRGLRLHEAPYTAMGPLAADVASALVDRGLVGNHALFGHSMGALLAYEVACELRTRGQAAPLHLFVSGSRAPHLYGDRDDHRLSDDGLRRLVRDLGGLGADETVGSVYLERRLPVLRADLTACEQYRWSPRRPLSCPMTAFSAAGDPIATEPQVEGWREYTDGSLLRRHLAGGHFFLNGPSRFPLLREIRAELARRRAAGTGERDDRPPAAPAADLGRRAPVVPAAHGDQHAPVAPPADRERTPGPDADRDRLRTGHRLRDRLPTPERDSSWTF